MRRSSIRAALGSMIGGVPESSLEMLTASIGDESDLLGTPKQASETRTTLVGRRCTSSVAREAHGLKVLFLAEMITISPAERTWEEGGATSRPPSWSRTASTVVFSHAAYTSSIRRPATSESAVTVIFSQDSIPLVGAGEDIDEVSDKWLQRGEGHAPAADAVRGDGAIGPSLEQLGPRRPPS